MAAGSTRGWSRGGTGAIAVAVIAVAVIGVVALATRLAGDRSSDAVTIEDSGVSVRLRYAGEDRGEVVALFTPLEPGFHLYGPDLPRDGINGAGRPTLLELSDAPGWRVAGALRAEPAVTLQSLPTFDQPFPVFPDGPVTMQLPVERLSPSSDTRQPLRVTVSYMACSSSGLCLAPVTGRPVEVPVE